MTYTHGAVTVVIPTHPPRLPDLTTRAVVSVMEQTRPADALIVELDTNSSGAAKTRNLALAKVTTEWTAFLDSDDEFMPEHLERLTACADETDADVVYPIPVWSGTKPARLRMELTFCPYSLRVANYIPVTTLVRTELLHSIEGGAFTPKSHPYPHKVPHEDWACWLSLLDMRAKFVHLPEVTWIWHWEHKKGHP